jgi:hypothetical protein
VCRVSLVSHRKFCRFAEDKELLCQRDEFMTARVIFRAPATMAALRFMCSPSPCQVHSVRFPLVCECFRHHEPPISPGRLAQYTLALGAICKDPRDFHGHDLISKHTAARADRLTHYTLSASGAEIITRSSRSSGGHCIGLIAPLHPFNYLISRLVRTPLKINLSCLPF